MNIWLITVGEPLPIDGDNARLLRTGILAKQLATNGHQVLWWSSDFDHVNKRARYGMTKEFKLEEGLRLRLLSGSPYKKNISLKRIQNHRETARQFAHLSERETVPDVILCSMPTAELLEAAVDFGVKHNTPVIADIRDLWPDIFLDYAPRGFRWAAAPAVGYLRARLRKALSQCHAIVGVSQSYVDWGLRNAEREALTQDRAFPLGYRKRQLSPINFDVEMKKLLQLGVDPNRTVCWFVGIFGHTYDIGTLIRTARLFQEQGKDDVQFVLSGKGDLLEAYQREAKDLKNVIFTGWLNSDALTALSSLAQIGLAAYAKGAPQSLPNKIFEYFAGELAVVSSLKSECEELLMDSGAGLNYAAGDPDSLFDSLSSLLNNPALLKQMQRNAIDLFHRSFSSESVYRQFEEYLVEQATQRKRVPLLGQNEKAQSIEKR